MFVCDACNEPATQMAQDLQQIISEGKWMDYRAVGKKRYGCNQHKPLDPLVFDATGQIMRSYESLERLCHHALSIQPPPLRIEA
jgi:hypothetical protein